MEESPPKLTFTVEGKFVDLPLNGKWRRHFTDFADKRATVLEGVSIEQTTSPAMWIPQLTS